MARGRSKGRHENLAADRGAPVGPRWEALKVNPAFISAPKPTRLGDIDLPATKISTSAETLKADKLAQEKRFGIDEVHVVDAELKAPVREQPSTPPAKAPRKTPVKLGRFEKAANKKVKERAAKKIAPPKKVSLRAARDLPYDPKTFLGKNQYVSSSGIVHNESRARMAQRAEASAKAAERLKGRLSKISRAATGKVAKRTASDARDVIRRKEYARTRNAAASAGRAKVFSDHVRRLSGFGKTPLKMMLAKHGAYSGRVVGKSLGMKNFSREEVYPARKLGTSAPFVASAVGRQTLVDNVGDLRAGSRRGTMFSTVNTIGPNRFTAGGDGGVFFRIDASHVITNLIEKYPAAIKAASIEIADTIGRKMLDIVEPYVPKETGAMYMSGETNVQQTAAGMVDMEGGEAYPAGQMFGVSISYNTAYANLVYFDEARLHGRAYNQHYGTGEKDDRETARWIEVAFKKEKGALTGLLNDYAVAITAAMSVAGISTTRSRGHQFDYKVG